METDTESERAILRTRDFWSSLVLIGLSLFFLWKTSHIPLFGGNRAGVSGADWYTSAAIVPLGIFGGMLVLALMLLATAIREGGAARALSAIGIGWDRAEALRFATIAVILFFYVASLVPRVDFILGSGLLITALIGYRLVFAGRPRPVFETDYKIPSSRVIDARLIGGSAVFGIGWGISGFCPGGVIPALGLGYSQTVLFTGAMIGGILLARLLNMSVLRPRSA